MKKILLPLLLSASLSTAFAADNDNITHKADGAAVQINTSGLALAWYGEDARYTVGLELDSSKGIAWNEGDTGNDKGISYGVFGRYNVAISNRLYSGLGTGLYNMNIEKNKAFLTDYKVPVYTFLEYDLNEEGSLKTSISVQLLTFDRRENGNNSVSSLTTGSMQLTYLFM